MMRMNSVARAVGSASRSRVSSAFAFKARVPATHVAPWTSLSARAFSGAQVDDMFCYQCEQTKHGVGCSDVGVCGKTASTARYQDLTLHYVSGIAQLAHCLTEAGGVVPMNVNNVVTESTFATLTNVNFDNDRFLTYLEKLNAARDELRTLLTKNGIDWKSMDGPCNFEFVGGEAGLMMEARLVSVTRRKTDFLQGNDDLLGLREMSAYGMKGLMAYWAHAERVRALHPEGAKAVSSAEAARPEMYGEDEAREVYSEMYRLLEAIADVKSHEATAEHLLGVNMACGGLNLKVMELLDRAHTACFGHPFPAEVSTIPRLEDVDRPCILISGHDIADVLLLLKQTEGMDLDVYTHGELLPAHSYPTLRTYTNLKGHFGKAWQKQKVDFAAFPGVVVMTSNCLIQPTQHYSERIFSTNAVGWPGMPHLPDTAVGTDFAPAIAKAKQSLGFSKQQIEALAATGHGSSSAAKLVIGFGHNTILSVADKVLAAVKGGAVKHIFLIGGCDGSEGNRNYFTDMAGHLPEESLLLTLGCGKFRVNATDLGNVGGATGPDAIPRLLDMGQCNDAYGAVKVALALADALGAGSVNDLPLHFAVSWFEQKAVAVLLTLLHLNVQGIRLGPNLPAFLTPTLLDILNQKFKLQAVSGGRDATGDVAQMLKE